MKRRTAPDMENALKWKPTKSASISQMFADEHCGGGTVEVVQGGTA
jgi:hypothetical protein